MTRSLNLPRLTRKRLGEWAEVRFTDAAMLRGLCALRPWGDSDRFDSLVISPRPHRIVLPDQDTNYRVPQPFPQPRIARRGKGRKAERQLSPLRNLETRNFETCTDPIIQALIRFFRERPKISRVQIRATRQFRDNRYEVCVQHTGGHYTTRDADFLAAYVVPLDVWYIIPISAITSRTKIHLAPHRPNNLYCERFREAWHLLM